ncbi:MAG: type II secretion system protein [Minisyncoccia bacterium]
MLSNLLSKLTVRTNNCLFGRARRSRLAAGFTLIELLVVLAIIVIISLIIFTSASKFNSAILLRSLAYDVGLAVREAQLYGVAVRETSGSATCSTGGSTQFCAWYGVHFDTSHNNKFFVFADIDESGEYDSSPDVQTDLFQTQYGFIISDFCVGSPSTNQSYCSAACPSSTVLTDAGLPTNNCTSNALTDLDITFRRPDPNAYIMPTFSAGVVGPVVTYTGALVTVQTPGGEMRSVSVSSTGQIAVLND